MVRAWLSAVSALAVLCAAPSGSVACELQELTFGTAVSVALLIESTTDREASIEAIACSRDRVEVRLLAGRGGAVLATGSLTRRPEGLDVAVTAQVAGTYRIGERVRSAELNVIDHAGTAYTAGRMAHEQRFYPYNWTLKASPSAIEMPVDLASPGVVADGIYFIPADVDLARQEMVTGPDFAEARLLVTKYFSTAEGDKGNTELALHDGEAITASLDVASDLGAIESRKWGAPSPVAERMTQLPFRDWSHEGYNLSATDYRKIAIRAAGGLDALIIRTMAPEKWVADIFKAQGLRAYYYQYLAAVRVLDNRGTLPRGVRPEWVVHETGEAGASYTAPVPRRGAWQILDIRRQDVRDYFVGIVEKVLRNGWDGVFYDGSLLWADAQGRFGGDASGCVAGAGACISFVEARARLLKEVRTAMRRLDPNGKLGMLVGNRFFDQLNVADYLLREAVDSGWQDNVSDPLRNRAVYSPSFSAEWLALEAPLLETNLVIGAKGENPLLIESALRWPNFPLQNSYFDVGDFDPGNVDGFATALGDLGAFRSGNRIVELLPATAAIVCVGPSLIEVDQDVQIRLARPIPAIDLAHLQYLGFADHYALSRGDRYVLAERQGSGKVRYSRERFAWFADDLYLFGSIRFARAPEMRGKTLLVAGERIDDGVVSLKAPVAPQAVLANGASLAVSGGDGLWRFVLPPGVTTLEVDL
jgi:hypothetical protein